MPYKAGEIPNGKTPHQGRLFRKYPPPNSKTTRGSEECRLQNCEQHTRLSVKKKKRTDLENLERHDRMLSDWRVPNVTTEYHTPPVSLDALTWSATDYQDVPIPENSVIYCDIPYKGTNRYAGKGADFDHDRFYEWALQQTQPIFISSYDMPKEDFKVIAEYSRTDTLSATNNSLRVTERIFIPRTQEYVKDNRKYKNENEQ